MFVFLLSTNTLTEPKVYMKECLLTISFNYDFIPLLVVVGIAWLVPMALSFLKMERIPAVIVEIIVGYFVGLALFPYIDFGSYAFLDFLALFGLVFLMFLSGLEIDVDQIVASFPKKRITLARFLRNPLLTGLVFFLVTLSLSYLGTILLSGIFEPKSKWFFTLILTTTSVGIIFPVLKNRGETSGHYGQMLIMAASIADILSIVLLTFTTIVLRFGFDLELVLILGIFIVFYIAFQVGKRLRRVLFQKITFQLAHAASQISIRGTMLLLLFFVVIGQVIGHEGILLGAFLSGLLLSIFLHKERSLLMIKLDGMGFGFFIPIFFIMVGAKFKLASFQEFDQSLFLFLGLLLLVLLGVKIIPSVIWARIFGIRRALAGGILLSARMSLIIAAASIGLELGVISDGVNASFIIMAVITCLSAPVLYNLINPKRSFLEDKVFIAGGSSVGVLLARRLQMHGKSSVIIENDPKRYKEMESKGLPVRLGDAAIPETYRDLKLSPGNYVVVMTGKDERNLKICEMLRQELHHEKIISRPSNVRFEQLLRKFNVEILDARRVLAATIENLILRPGTYHTLVDTFENYSVEEITITGYFVDGKAVKELPFHHDSMLMLLRRGTEMHIPHGNTFLKTGDIITVFGISSAIDEIRKMMGA
jgi:Kef-type K+ transport system membrane component KefB/Trk K+ transport system NAD-binding subunit